MPDLSTYSVVEFQFYPPILDVNGSLTDTADQYAIHIESPPIVLQKSIAQPIPTKIIKPFTLGELVTLYLTPSDVMVPTLKYKVGYYKKGNKVPLHQETWVVPQPLTNKQASLTIGPGNQVYALPMNFWRLKSLVAGVPLPVYEVRQNSLYFVSNPAADAQIMVEYTGKYTRFDVVWPEAY